MEAIIINGKQRLSGNVKIEGSKNAVLPILTASLLAENGKTQLKNVPELSDVNTLTMLLEYLGAKVNKTHGEVHIDASKELTFEAPYHLVSKMRASMLVMGPLLARYGYCNVAMPGGCAIGSRPIEQHIKGLEKMGVEFTMSDGRCIGSVDGKLKGANIYLDFPSVGATQNLMMAAALADGVTQINNVALEPEVVDLANYINAMGGKVRGAGTSQLNIHGVDQLNGTEHSIIPDRIEAGTFIIASAVTRSEITLENVELEHMTALVSKLEEIGIKIEVHDNKVRVIPNDNLKPINVKTMPHPGFPTDMQSQMMALLSTIDGTSSITETIFENRFMHVNEFNRMNASITVDDNKATINGEATNFKGARVKATDLRAAASLIIAGMAAEGMTIVTELKHLDRGYVKFHEKLTALGADVKRVRLEEVEDKESVTS